MAKNKRKEKEITINIISPENVATLKTSLKDVIVIAIGLVLGDILLKVFFNK